MYSHTKKDRRVLVRRDKSQIVVVFWLLLSTLAFPGIARSNGWEHLAIPRETLLAALKSGDTHTMEHAAISIGIRGEARDIEPLVAALDEAGDDHHLRVEIYRALGLIGDKAGTNTLLKALETEERPEVRAVVASSLGGIGAIDSVPALLDALQEEHKSVRARAVDALGAFNEPETIAVLSDLANSDNDGSLRRRAIRALGATNSAQAGEPLLNALANAKNEATQAVIIDSLAQIAPREAARPLTVLLNKTTSPVLQAKVAVALGAIGGETVVTSLTQLLSSDDRATQAAAVRMLTDAQSVDAAASLVKFYDKLARRMPAEKKELPEDVAAALADLDLMKSAIRALLQSDPQAGRNSFLNAAEYRHFERNSGASLKLAHRVYELRRVAIHALGYTEAPTVSAFLENVVTSDEDARLRSVAMRSIGVLEVPVAQPLALDALHDEDDTVRSTAATVLGRLGSSAVILPLIEALDDAHPQVRSQVALSLGLLNDDRAADHLELLIKEDSDEGVVDSARQALVMLAARLP